MRKYLGMMILGVVILGLASQGQTFKNEPTGFRGLTWGDSPTKQMVKMLDFEGQRAYTLPNDKMQLGNMILYRVAYVFWVQGYKQEKFIAGMMHFRGEKNLNLALKLCEGKFGQPQKSSYDEQIWLGAVGTVLLTYDYVEKKGFMTLASTLLSNQQQKQQLEKEQRKAKQDW